MGEDASQERTYLNPMLVEDGGHALIVRIHLDSMSGLRRTADTPRSTPRSHVRRGQWTHFHPGQERIHLNPMLGEDSGHLNPGLERVIIPLDSMSGEDTPQSCVCMGENISIPNFSNSSLTFQDALKMSKKDGDQMNLNCEGRGRVAEWSTITLKAR
jgi:hypothetical protein